MKSLKWALSAATSLALAGPCVAATVSDSITDMLPGLGGGALFDGPRFDESGLPGRTAVASLLDGARQDFDKAVDTLAEELERRADYASILNLAPELRVYLPRDRRLLALHALALSASGQAEEAEAALALIGPQDAADAGPLPRLAEAMTVYRRGETGQAAGLVRAALKRDPDHAYAHNLLGMILAAAGESAGALASFSEAARLAPETALFRRNLGVTQQGAGQLDAAAASLRAALDLAPEDCVSLVALARVEESRARPEESLALATRCLRANPEDARAAGYLVQLHVAGNRRDAALETIARYGGTLDDPQALTAEVQLQFNAPTDAIASLREEPLSADAAYRLALAEAMSGAGDAALQRLRELRARAPQTPGLDLAEVALSVAATGVLPANTPDSDDAGLTRRIAWFRALAEAPANAEAAAEAARNARDLLPGVRFAGLPLDEWRALAAPGTRQTMALGMLWLLAGYDRAAADHFARAAPTSHQARYFGAIASWRMKEPGTALELLRPTLNSLPDYSPAHLLAGEIQLSEGHGAEALASYRRAITVEEDGGALLKVGVLADMLGQTAVAEDALRRFIAIFPESMIGYNQLAWVFVQREMRLEEARELAEKADSLQPGNASVLDNLGWISFLQGDTEGALEVLRRANAVSDQSNPDILYHLAEAEAKAGGRTEGLDLLDRFARIAPAGHPARDRADRLRDRLE